LTKSFTPINPRGTSNPPAWVTSPDTHRVSHIHTDDTEFGPGYFSESNTVGWFCYLQQGKWYTVQIDLRRINFLARLPQTYEVAP